ncbi:unnamed protein product, partial [Prorocentrum cordatum]
MESAEQKLTAVLGAVSKLGARRALSEWLLQKAVAEAARAAVSDPAGSRQSQDQLTTFEGILGAGRKATSEEVRKALLSSGLDSGRELAKRWVTAHPDPHLAYEILEALDAVAGAETVVDGGSGGESSDDVPSLPQERLAQTAVKAEASQEKLDEKANVSALLAGKCLELQEAHQRYQQLLVDTDAARHSLQLQVQESEAKAMEAQEALVQRLEQAKMQEKAMEARCCGLDAELREALQLVAELQSELEPKVDAKFGHEGDQDLARAAGGRVQPEKAEHADKGLEEHTCLSVYEAAGHASAEAMPSADPSVQLPTSPLNVFLSADVGSILRALCDEEPIDIEKTCDFLNQGIFAPKPTDDDAIGTLIAMESACPVAAANVLADVVRGFDTICNHIEYIKSAARAA